MTRERALGVGVTCCEEGCEECPEVAIPIETGEDKSGPSTDDIDIDDIQKEQAS